MPATRAPRRASECADKTAAAVLRGGAQGLSLGFRQELQPHTDFVHLIQFGSPEKIKKGRFGVGFCDCAATLIHVPVGRRGLRIQVQNQDATTFLS